ncbi:hypothetical protein [Candidatus Oleimmundimicrobium sp.]|nr:hypothetical protein [Candidatus Oleimmundimicrobium sp.]MDO8885738.1 hypothetical protein [Candidatus Oleimmundimicrobium sp.]
MKDEGYKQLNTRLRYSLYVKLKEMCKKENVSVNQKINELVEKEVEGK